MAEITMMDIATSGLRAVANTLKETCNTTLTEMPVIEKVGQADVWVLMDKKDMYVSALPFSRVMKNNSVNNVAMLYIMKSRILDLFQSFGSSPTASQDELKNACGRFLSEVLEKFKAEIASLGENSVELGSVMNYAEKAEEKLDVKGSCSNYGMVFYRDGVHMFTVDIIMQELL